MKEKFEHIKSCHLFSELDAAVQKEIADICLMKKLEKGALIFSEGDDASAMYILTVGRVDLVKGSPDGREMPIRTVRAGETFAEAAMFSGETYPASAYAAARSTVLSLERKKLVSLVKRHPDVSLKMLGVMSILLRHLNDVLSEFSLGTVKERLAAYLIKRCEKEGRKFQLGIQKRELAAKLGTVPETLSRNLAKMMRDGSVRIEDDLIIVSNIDMLEKYR